MRKMVFTCPLATSITDAAGIGHDFILLDIVVTPFGFPVSELYTPGLKPAENNSEIIEQFKRNWEVRYWTQGFFREEYISEINIHWLTFSPPSTARFMILGVLYIFIMTIGIFGNGIVILLFCRCKTLRTPPNSLIINLAISDFLMVLKMPIFIYNSFHKGPVLGDAACRLYGFIGGLTGTASIGTLAAISFDRYYVIRFPLKRFSCTRIYVCLIGSWVYALSFSLIPILNIGLGKYQYEGYLISCSFDYLTENQQEKTFILVFFFAAFVLPLSVIGFSYFKIVQVVGGRSTEIGGKRDSFRHVKEEDKRKQEVKLAIIVLIVIFLWLFSWTPYSVVSLLGISGQKHLITPIASMIPALFCKTTSAIDPYLYAMSHPKFKEELRKLLGLHKKKKVTKSNHKVWSTDKKLTNTMKFDSTEYGVDDDVEEETVEVELKSVNLGEHSTTPYGNGDEMKTKERELKRRLTRQISSRSRSQSREEEETKIE